VDRAGATWREASTPPLLREAGSISNTGAHPCDAPPPPGQGPRGRPPAASRKHESTNRGWLLGFFFLDRGVASPDWVLDRVPVPKRPLRLRREPQYPRAIREEDDTISVVVSDSLTQAGSAASISARRLALAGPGGGSAPTATWDLLDQIDRGAACTGRPARATCSPTNSRSIVSATATTNAVRWMVAVWVSVETPWRVAMP
jgi:hypothetical protein